MGRGWLNEEKVDVGLAGQRAGGTDKRIVGKEEIEDKKISANDKTKTEWGDGETGKQEDKSREGGTQPKREYENEKKQQTKCKKEKRKKSIEGE